MLCCLVKLVLRFALWPYCRLAIVVKICLLEAAEVLYDGGCRSLLWCLIQQYLMIDAKLLMMVFTRV